MEWRLSEYTGRACNAGTAFEFIPLTQTETPLENVALALEHANVPLDIRSPLVLVFSFEGKELSWYKSGKILVKGETDATRAKNLTHQLFDQLNQHPA